VPVPVSPAPSPDDQRTAQRIRTIRLANGVTIKQAAATARVSETSWKHWERGTHRPTLQNGSRIAAALGVPVAALFLEDGWQAVTDVNLTPDAVARVRRDGSAEAQRLADLVAAQLPALILAACRTPSKPAPRGTRAKPRRSRAEVLAGIAEANAMRAARAARDQQPGLGPPQA
jgi:transcriptional regulator with XRE-family HTH domain